MLRFFRKKSGSPSASDVVSRALILKSQIVTRMAIPPPEMLQSLLTSWSSSDREQFLKQCCQRQTQVAEALKEAGVGSAMSWSERTFMLASPDQIDPQALRDVSWSMESAECLIGLANVRGFDDGKPATREVLGEHFSAVGRVVHDEDRRFRGGHNQFVGRRIYPTFCGTGVSSAARGTSIAKTQPLPGKLRK